MIRIYWRGLWLLALCSWTLAATAEIVPDLYQTTVPVNEQSGAELRRAAGIGLAEVLVRVSGRSDAAAHSGLSTALAGADRYLDQYRYERNPTNTGAPWQVRLQFAANPVEQLLRGAGLPVWGANRPGVLVWLAVDDGRSRTLVNDNSHAELVAALREQARRRGLVLHFPQEAGGVASAEDVWQMDVARVQMASERYRSAALLLGRLQQGSGGRWQGGWILAVNGQRSSAENDGDSLTNYLTPGFNRIADALAAQYTATAVAGAPNSGAEGLLLRVTGVENFDDYARALAYLQQLGVVKSVLPLQFDGDAIVMRLQIEGSVDLFTRQLALDNRLLPADVAPAPTAAAASLQYRWARPAPG